MEQCTSTIRLTLILANDGPSVISFDLMTEDVIEPIIAMDPISVVGINSVCEENTKLGGAHSDADVTEPITECDTVGKFRKEGEVGFHPPNFRTERGERGAGSTGTTAPARTATTTGAATTGAA